MERLNNSRLHKKAVEFAAGKFLVYHKNLREKILKSALMDGRKYTVEIENFLSKYVAR